MGTIPETDGFRTANPQEAVDDDAGHVYAPRFSQIPESLVDADVSDRAYRLYGLLHRYAGRDGRAFPGRRMLAERLRCSTSSIIRAIKELVEHGYLMVEPNFRSDGAQRANDYHLLGWGLVTDSPTPVVSREERGVSRKEGGVPLVARGRSTGDTHKDNQVNDNQGKPLLAPNGAKATDDPLKKCAHRLTVKAMERKHKPVIARSSNPFPAVMKLTSSLLRAGWSDRDIERVYTTQDRVVWTIAGLTAALEQNMRAERAKQTVRSRPKSEAELLMEAQEETRALWEEET